MILEDYRNYFIKQLEGIFPLEEVTTITSIALQFVLKKNRVEVALSRKQELSTSQKKALDEILERLLLSEPIQYITASTHFYGLDLQLTKATLIPRPETEELVEWILEETQNKTEALQILDIGTGSGCMAIALAKNLPKSQVEAIDISLAALETAQANALAHKVSVGFYQQDILEATRLKNSYDVIVSNPPYVRELEKAEIKENVLHYEPHQALFVTDSNPLLFYKKIAELALQHLLPNGQLYFEINEYLGKETVSLIETLGFSKVLLKKDLLGKDRMIQAQA